jgi:hypothetical protein
LVHGTYIDNAIQSLFTAVDVSPTHLKGLWNLFFSKHDIGEYYTTGASRTGPLSIALLVMSCFSLMRDDAQEYLLCPDEHSLNIWEAFARSLRCVGSTLSEQDKAYTHAVTSFGTFWQLLDPRHLPVAERDLVHELLQPCDQDLISIGTSLSFFSIVSHAAAELSSLGEPRLAVTLGKIFSRLVRLLIRFSLTFIPNPIAGC